MPNQDETIGLQQPTSETQESVVTPETQDLSNPGQSQNVEEEHLIPQKFVGMSAIEIAQEYKKLESEYGRRANEIGQLRKETEEAKQRFLALEQARSAMPTQAPVQQVQPEVAVDPFSALDEEFEDDPKAAIRKSIEVLNSKMERQMQMQSYQQRQQEAQNWYMEQKKANPDYSRREAAMQQLALEFQDIIKPEYMNSKKVLEALDYMSRGKDLDFYTKDAVAKAQKSGSSVREEKRRAQSESATAEGDQLREFSSLSLEEMAKLLGRAD